MSSNRVPVSVGRGAASPTIQCEECLGTGKIYSQTGVDYWKLLGECSRCDGSGLLPACGCCKANAVDDLEHAFHGSNAVDCEGCNEEICFDCQHVAEDGYGGTVTICCACVAPSLRKKRSEVCWAG